tara:strand:+ start:79722 stop:80279 length:558 start_codon:yes stop_codon:yes gene_type:complete
MNQLLDKMEEIEFTTGPNFSYSLDREFELISSNLESDKKELLKEDFTEFFNKGRFLVLNTFSGGILFLKAPERIEKIKIDSRTTSYDFEASVIFESDSRNTENIKYKSEGGKTESIEWHVSEIFPNFYKYDKTIRIALLIVIGKIVKRICEYGRLNFAYLKIENEFEIELLINGQVESKLKIELE